MEVGALGHHLEVVPAAPDHLPAGAAVAFAAEVAALPRDRQPELTGRQVGGGDLAQGGGHDDPGPWHHLLKGLWIIERRGPAGAAGDDAASPWIGASRGVG